MPPLKTIIMTESKHYPYLPIEDGNSLVRTDSNLSQRKGMDNDDDYFDEVDANGNVVAKYHVWHHMNIYPPQRVNEGWKKLDLEGNVIAEGKTT